MKTLFSQVMSDHVQEKHHHQNYSRQWTLMET